MTDSPSEPTTEEEAPAGEANGDAGSLGDFAQTLSETVGGSGWSTDHDTVRITVDRDSWVDALRRARDEGGLPFFSWLSAVDWSRDVSVGEQVEEPDQLDERYQVIARLSSVTSAAGAQFITDVPKDDAWVDSLVPVFGGAEWHEREAAEMFGIDFRGHPKLVNLYLPDAFEGFPLRKSYPLLSREVKPWPGTVDVEDMPSTENIEADAAASSDNGDDA